MSTFDELLNEYKLSENKAGKNSRGEELQGNIGELMFKHLIKLVKLRKLSNEINSGRWSYYFYNNAVKWNDSEKEDLAMELVTSTLLGEGKIDYLYDVAHDINSLNSLLNEMVNRLLRGRLQKTLASNIISRLKKKLGDDGFEPRDTPDGRWYGHRDSKTSPLQIDAQKWRHLIEEIRKIPRIPFNERSERAWTVWSTSAFNSLVLKVVGDREGLFLSDMDKILKEVLTDSVPSTLIDIDGLSDDSEGKQEFSNSGSPSVEDLYGEIEMKNYVSEYIAKLDRNEVAVLALKGGQGLSDEEIMPYLGVRSRQTVQRVRESLGEKIAKDFGTRFTSSESRAAGAYLIELCYEQFTLMDFA
jgi:hypothetical protein